MNKPSVNRRKKAVTWANRSGWRTESLETWKPSAKWFSTKDLTSNNSFWKHWNKSKKRNAGNCRKRRIWNRASSYRNSCLWLSPDRSSQRKTLSSRIRLRSSKLTKSLLSWVIWIGLSVKLSSDSSSQRWTQVTQPSAGETLPLVALDLKHIQTTQMPATQTTPPNKQDSTEASVSPNTSPAPGELDTRVAIFSIEMKERTVDKERIS